MKRHLGKILIVFVLAAQAGTLAAAEENVHKDDGEAKTPPTPPTPPTLEGLPTTIRAIAPVPAEKERRRPAEKKEVPPQSLPPADLRLAVGEKLTYGIRWNGLPAGEATLTVAERDATVGPEAWVIRLQVQSSRAVSAFYPVKNRIVSRVDTAGGFSRHYNSDRREGDLSAEERIEFDYVVDDPRDAPHAVCRRPRADGKLKTYQVPLPGKALDPLAALYYLRATPLALNGPPAYLPICADRRLHNLRLQPAGREELEIAVDGMGAADRRRMCWLLIPRCGFHGLFERRSEMKIWIDQRTHIPLKMTVEIPIGTATATLQRQENSPLDPDYVPPPKAK